eukprot:PhM_4_TR6288/c3_g1_i1/m.93837
MGCKESKLRADGEVAVTTTTNNNNNNNFSKGSTVLSPIICPSTPTRGLPHSNSMPMLPQSTSPTVAAVKSSSMYLTPTAVSPLPVVRVVPTIRRHHVVIYAPRRQCSDTNRVKVFLRSKMMGMGEKKRRLGATEVAEEPDVKVVEVDSMAPADAKTLVHELSMRYGCRRLPAVFVRGRYVGGAEDTVEAYSSGLIDLSPPPKKKSPSLAPVDIPLLAATR